MRMLSEEEQKVARAQTRKIVGIGFAATLLLACIAFLAWAAWSIALAHWWPTAPTWVPWILHVCCAATAVPVVLSIHWVMEEHRYCGNNRWQYECALYRLPENVFVSACGAMFAPVFVLVFLVAALNEGREFLKNAWADHQRQRSPAASP